ncbi:MAG: DUF3592 domain-containing protein [Planctomycetota bacterium]
MLSWLLGTALLLGGSALFACALRDAALVRRARTWPRTIGQVIHCLPPGRSRHGEVEVVYEYRVGRRIFRNMRICAGFEQRRGPLAWIRCRRYQETTRVVVAYDPENPFRSCVEPRSDYLRAAVLGGVVYVLVGSAVALGLV